jgi:hypothetical protein
MAAAILRNDPDALLTQPKAVLPRLLAGENSERDRQHRQGQARGIEPCQCRERRRPPDEIAPAMGQAWPSMSPRRSRSQALRSGSPGRAASRDLTEFLLLFSTFPGSIYSGVPLPHRCPSPARPVRFGQFGHGRAESRHPCIRRPLHPAVPPLFPAVLQSR